MSSIKINYLYNMAYQVLQVIIPLITTPYVARVLGAEGIGCFSYTRSIAYYFLLVGMLGVNNYGNRKIAQAREDNDKLSKIFSEIYQVQFTVSTLSIISYICYISLFCNEYQDIAMFQLMYILSAAFDINWFFFGLEKFKITVVCKSIIKVFSAALIFVFVRDSSDLYLYTIVMSMSYFLGQCYLWMYLNKYAKFKLCSLKEMLPHIKPLLILFLPTIATSIYRVMDKIMIGNMTSIADVGLYENADKIIVVCLGVISAWGNVMLPRASNLYGKNNVEQCKKNLERSIAFILLVSAGMTFGLAAISNDLVLLLFGEGFTGSGVILCGLSITILFVGISNTTRTQILIPLGHDKQYLFSVMIGAFFNVIINFIFIKQIGVMGAVIGTISTEFLVAVIQVYIVRSHVDITKIILANCPYIVIGSLMYTIVKIFISSTNFDLIISVVVAIAIGVLSYAIGVLSYWNMTDNNFFTLIKDKIRK